MTTPPKRRRGGQPKPPSQRRSVRLVLYLTPGEWERVAGVEIEELRRRVLEPKGGE